MKRARVLLVEDNEDDVLLVQRAFRASDSVELELARDGGDALKRLLCQAPPQLVLLDLRLPGMSGFEVLRRIREDERTRYLPVIIFTNSQLEADRTLAAQRGANSYVLKPLDEETLQALVRYVERYWVPLHRQPSCPG